MGAEDCSIGIDTWMIQLGPDVFFYERDAFAYLPKDIDEKDEKE